MKKLHYRDIKIREKARVLSADSGIALDDAIAIVKKERDNSDNRLKAIGKKSKSKLRKEARSAQKDRNSTLKEFGVNLSPGLKPVQGGAPSLGKKR